jgi:Zn ribbon nucleic-acid-binding protein
VCGGSGIEKIQQWVEDGVKKKKRVKVGHGSMYEQKE